jgi:anti-anti-sigma regulatory factor
MFGAILPRRRKPKRSGAMKDFINGWSADVDRGPDCLLVRLHAPDHRPAEGTGLADDLWSLMKSHLVRRMVLELDEIDRLQTGVVGQLVRLHDRLDREGGLLRICGLSDQNQQVLQACRLESRLPNYHTRRDALLGGQCRVDPPHQN